MYTYWSHKFEKGNNSLYSTFQYGLFSKLDVTADYTKAGDTYFGTGLRVNLLKGENYSLGSHAVVNWNFDKYYDYAGTWVGVYGNYSIDKFTIINNLFYSNYKGSISWSNWLYGSYNIGSWNPTVGYLREGDNNFLAVGVWKSIGRYNIYLWGSKLNTDNKRLVVGIDYKL